jgi:hydroxypyruvate isomerase
MPRFAANLSFLYQELPFLERFRAAAEDGFKGVEYLFPYEYDPETIAACLQDNGLQQVVFNAPPGNWAAGERGIAAVPGRELEFRSSIATALDYAVRLGNPLLHVMAGLAMDTNNRDAMRETYLDNLRYAAHEAAEVNRIILIEPINLRDMPGYFLNSQEQAHTIRAEVEASNLKVQFDLYHAQIVEGDLETKLRQWAGEYVHVQVASVPLRNEPDRGETNYPHLFRVLDDIDYRGWVGCEYRPSTTTRDGLDWFRKHRDISSTK